MPFTSPARTRLMQYVLHTTPSQRIGSASLLVCGGLLAAAIALHAALLPLSRWQGDEFHDVALFRAMGAPAYYLFRVTTWSPRPVSEFVLSLYYAAILHWHSPLVETFMALLWLLLISASLAGLWRRPDLVKLVLGLALFASFLLSSSLEEVFFWPQGAAAYLVTLLAMTALFWETLEAASLAAPFPALALAVAGGSSEVGALFVLCFGILACPAVLQQTRAWHRLALFAAPCLLAAWVLFHLATYRVGTIEFQPASGKYLHHLLPSLHAAFPLWLHDVLGTGARPGRFQLVLFAAGFAACWRARDIPAAAAPWTPLAYAAALLATSYITLAAAFYQFDFACCPRHETLRQCSLYLAAAAIGAQLARLLPPLTSYWRMLAPVPLMLALWPAFGVRLPLLRTEYRLIPITIADRTETWASGQQPARCMVFVPAPQGPLVPNFDPPPGHYKRSDNPPWQIAGIMDLFGKQELTVARTAPPTGC